VSRLRCRHCPHRVMCASSFTAPDPSAPKPAPMNLRTAPPPELHVLPVLHPVKAASSGSCCTCASPDHPLRHLEKSAGPINMHPSVPAMPRHPQRQCHPQRNIHRPGRPTPAWFKLPARTQKSGRFDITRGSCAQSASPSLPPQNTLPGKYVAFTGGVKLGAPCQTAPPLPPGSNDSAASLTVDYQRVGRRRLTRQRPPPLHKPTSEPSASPPLEEVDSPVAPLDQNRWHDSGAGHESVNSKSCKNLSHSARRDLMTPKSANTGSEEYLPKGRICSLWTSFLSRLRLCFHRAPGLGVLEAKGNRPAAAHGGARGGPPAVRRVHFFSPGHPISWPKGGYWPQLCRAGPANPACHHRCRHHSLSRGSAT